MSFFLSSVAHGRAGEKSELNVSLEHCRFKVPEWNLCLLLQVSEPSGEWVQGDHLFFQFSTLVRPQSESHPQAEFRLLFTRVGAHQGTESVGGISSAASLIMQSWCRNLDTVQPYCFFSGPLTQRNHSKNIGCGASACWVFECRSEMHWLHWKWLCNDPYEFCLLHAWVVGHSARQK